MLPDQQPTSFDLTFRVLGFPVRVHPLFWVGMAVLGWPYFQAHFGFGLIWVACGFVSILVHELGHALVIRRYGSPAAIWLYAFGGLAIPSYEASSASRRLLIALAGPAAGFLFLGIVWGSEQAFHWTERGGPNAELYLFVVFRTLVIINLVWNLLNLLPIWPLDGGRALREILDARGVRQPDVRAYWVSTITAGALALFGIAVYLRLLDNVLADTSAWWLTPGPMWTILMIVLAVNSYMMLKQLRQGPRYYAVDDDRLPWERR